MAALKYCLLFALLLSVCLKGGASKSLSMEQVNEDLEIERQLRILNKPPIKTIHTEWGDILDCVDINKQPAFDHPLLKNHKIQMKPSFSLKGDEKSSSTQNDDQYSSIFKIPSESCPKGTVPIRRTSRQDLSRAAIRRTSGQDLTRAANSKIKFPGQSLAGLRYNISGETYYGAAALIDVYNPPLSSDDQFSSAEIAIENGSDNQINSIRVGWMVNPQVFGDHMTRLFTLWTSDNYQKTGCYNILCPGFVQVHSAIGPTSPIPKTSVYGGEQFTINFQLNQDKDTGNWWLVIQNNTNVGYWPKNLFESLSEGCSHIYWGGHVKASGSGDSPKMGSGYHPEQYNYQKACFYNYIQYMDGNNTFLNPKQYYVITVNECVHYSVEYNGFEQGGFGHTFLFGGPGGQCP